jgi:hypothetical protein
MTVMSYYDMNVPQKVCVCVYVRETDNRNRMYTRNILTSSLSVKMNKVFFFFSAVLVLLFTSTLDSASEVD